MKTACPVCRAPIDGCGLTPLCLGCGAFVAFEEDGSIRLATETELRRAVERIGLLEAVQALARLRRELAEQSCSGIGGRSDAFQEFEGEGRR